MTVYVLLELGWRLLSRRGGCDLYLIPRAFLHSGRAAKIITFYPLAKQYIIITMMTF
jgi:hypothetical protein